MRPFSILASLLSLASALSINPRSNPTRQPAHGHVVHQFPNTTWIENIAVRKNGQLLITIATAPELYLVDPLKSSLDPTSSAASTLIHTFAPFTAVLGITETIPNQFFVIVGKFSLTPPVDEALGPYTIYSVNLSSSFHLTKSAATVHEVAALPSAGLLNGMSTLSAASGLIIAVDSVYGSIYLINTKTGASSILLKEPEMLPPAGAQLGINGVHVLPPKQHSDSDTVSIYFSNEGSKAFYRVPFSLSTLNKLGPVERLFEGYAVDDFALDGENGVAWLAGAEIDSLLRVGLDGGEAESVYGGNETLVSPTSVALGRGRDGEEMREVYVTTQKGEVVGVDVGC